MGENETENAVKRKAIAEEKVSIFELQVLNGIYTQKSLRVTNKIFYQLRNIVTMASKHIKRYN